MPAALLLSRRSAWTGGYPSCRSFTDNGGNKDAKRWLALWIGADGEEHGKVFAKQSDAQKHGTAMEADALRGIRYADPRRGAITVREYGEDVFLPSMLHLRPNSADTYASHLRNHIYPALGTRKMGTLTRTDAQSFVSLVSSRVAPTTTETVYAVLRAMVQSAINADPQVIPAHPCTRIKLPKAGKRVVEPLPAATIVALHDTITPRYRVAVALGAGLGLREGEAFGLTLPSPGWISCAERCISSTRPSDRAGQTGQCLASLDP